MQDAIEAIKFNSAPFRARDWTVDPARCTLARAGVVLHIEPKVMDVLVCLARRGGAVVSKEELIREVWDGRFVTDDVITVSIHELRKALGDSARQPQYVETIARRGYRWIAGVEELSQPASAHEPHVIGLSRGWLWLAAAGILLALGVASWSLRPQPMSRLAASANAPGVEAAYQKGRHFLNQRSPDSLAQALTYFEEAVRLNPRFAEGHAAIALATIHQVDAGATDRAALVARARKETRRALELNPNVADAHAALGMMYLVFDWNFTKSEEEFRRALQLNPALMAAHQGYAWLLSATGRHPEAIAAAQQAVNADPATPARYTELAWTLSYSGRYREAVRETERALELDPQNFEAHLTRGMMLELMGDAPAAYAAIRKGYASRAGGEEIVQRLDATYRAEGLRGIYRAWLRIMEGRTSPTMPRNDVWLASLYSRVGDVERAIAALQSAYDRHEGGLAWLRVNPSFMPLRYDARFQSLVQRVGLAN